MAPDVFCEGLAWPAALVDLNIPVDVGNLDVHEPHRTPRRRWRGADRVRRGVLGGADQLVGQHQLLLRLVRLLPGSGSGSG